MEKIPCALIRLALELAIVLRAFHLSLLVNPILKPSPGETDGVPLFLCSSSRYKAQVTRHKMSDILQDPSVTHCLGLEEGMTSSGIIGSDDLALGKHNVQRWFQTSRSLVCSEETGIQTREEGSAAPHRHRLFPLETEVFMFGAQGRCATSSCPTTTEVCKLPWGNKMALAILLAPRHLGIWRFPDRLSAEGVLFPSSKKGRLQLGLA